MAAVCPYPFKCQKEEAYGQTPEKCFQKERNDFSQLKSGIFGGSQPFWRNGLRCHFCPQPPISSNQLCHSRGSVLSLSGGIRTFQSKFQTLISFPSSRPRYSLKGSLQYKPGSGAIEGTSVIYFLLLRNHWHFGRSRPITNRWFFFLMQGTHYVNNKRT